MNIQRLKIEKFGNGGSSTLRIFQNNSMPILDLLVRESIQNSLDAALPNVKAVKVELDTKEIITKNVAKHFDTISDLIVKKVGKEKSKYISIRDYNTYGLTGDYDGKFDHKKPKQNFNKLVFNLMKNQTEEGAGGSWGMGKTIYFRLGIGLVVFYSRVKLEDGSYQERMAATFVEDETKEDGILNNFPDNTGIAFFGKKSPTENNIDNVIAETDSQKIKEVLDSFNIVPYKDAETGTTIIIPFINEADLIVNNAIEGEKINWWETDITEYLNLAILRWYFPRMASKYSYGPILEPYVNKAKVTTDENSPLFTYFIDMYNESTKKSPKKYELELIKRTANMENSTIGTFVYTVLTNDDLNLSNLPDPYKYTLSETKSINKGKPIIAFCRKPGMVIRYAVDSNVCSEIVNNKDEFIIGIFVLNSNNNIVSPVKLNLDEYVRQGEKADHTSWDDHQILGCTRKIQIVNNLYSSINRILKEKFNGDEDDSSGDSELNEDLASSLAKLLLPKDNFGNGTSDTPKKREPKPKGTVIIKSKRDKVLFIKNRYEDDYIKLKYQVIINSNVKEIIFKNNIHGIGGSIDPLKWEKDGLVYPCNIDKIALIKASYDGKDTPQQMTYNFNCNQINASFIDFDIQFLKTVSGHCYGIKFVHKNEYHKCSFVINMQLSYLDRQVHTSMNVSLESEKNE